MRDNRFVVSMHDVLDWTESSPSLRGSRGSLDNHVRTAGNVEWRTVWAVVWSLAVVEVDTSIPIGFQVVSCNTSHRYSPQCLASIPDQKARVWSAMVTSHDHHLDVCLLHQPWRFVRFMFCDFNHGKLCTATFIRDL